ncbi:DUF2795 domain-containing protein [Pseudonocardia phyllosphaerae]|uniref:DUF2795 domain-containing protein n=1 Tax=Pseudonocardia phyllosphaerae TaxID=3390502 RepID=UPI00397A5B8E
MSAPAARRPGTPAPAGPTSPAAIGPAPTVHPAPRTFRPAPRRPAGPPDPAQEVERLRHNLRRVLAGLHWPAARWQILAEAEAWGVSGVVRHQLVPLPEGRYPSVDAIVEMLVALARGGVHPGRPARPGQPPSPPPARRRP